LCEMYQSHLGKGSNLDLQIWVAFTFCSQYSADGQEVEHV
jgi:hypothetical protein